MVVDLPVDRQHVGARGVEQRLGSTVDADDGQAFMGQDGAIAVEDTTPVGPAMTLTLGEPEGQLPKLAVILPDLENAENRAHGYRS